MRDIVFKKVERNDANLHLEPTAKPAGGAALFSPVISSLPEPPELPVIKPVEPSPALPINRAHHSKPRVNKPRALKLKESRLEMWLNWSNQQLGKLVSRWSGNHPPKVIQPALSTINPAGQTKRIFSTHKQGNLIFRALKPKPKAKPQIELKLSSTPRSNLRQKLTHQGHKVISSAKTSYCNTKTHLKHPIGKIAAVNSLIILGLIGYLFYSNNLHPQSAERNLGTSLNSVTTLRQFTPIVGSVEKSSTYQETNFSNQNQSLTAWITPWNIGQYQATNTAYAQVSAFWLTIGVDGYSVTPKADWASWDSYVQSSGSAIKTKLLSVTGNPDSVAVALTDSTVQTKLINSLLSTVKAHQFDGIDLDLEGLGFDNQSLFTNFVRNLNTVFDNENKLVAVTLEARIANQVPMDWHALGQIADEVRIMVYDYHAKETGNPGPISPLGWIKEVTQYAIANIEPQKVVIGLGNYGYDWSRQSADQSYYGVGVSHDLATALASEHNAPIMNASGIDERGYDIGIAPNFNYLDPDGTEHSVWFEDQTSIQLKVDLLRQYPIKGVIFWSVGITDPQA